MTSISRWVSPKVEASGISLLSQQKELYAPWKNAWIIGDPVEEGTLWLCQNSY
jgi:hypothetical protein